MVMKVLRVAFAFVGIIVGAGFATGQEIMQYFVAFGINGIWGAVLSAVIMSVWAMIILQLGSYFRAAEHGEVFRRVSHPIFSRVLDIGVVITLFATGFVMFAGAGANMNQQWGTPVWVGAVIMVAITIAAGFLDVDRVTTVIGSITPFIVAFIVLASIYTLAFTDPTPMAERADAVAAVATTLPHWTVAAVNYVGFNLMVAVSMAIVIGGNMFHPRVAGVGGFFGGLIYSALLLISALTLYYTVGTVATDAVPMLSVINRLHPWLGQAMAVVIFGMIFNTALGMFYALARRLTASRPERFHVVYVATVVLGFILSFVGFQNLIGWVYPVLGYIGLLLIAVMLVAWLRGRGRISEEASRRGRISRLLAVGDRSEARREIEDSNLSAAQVREAIEDGQVGGA
ncbi:YkvI family membrane protein [Corynebacterium lactis]|uniref:Membrane protein n=1 Tax=Corynebacterium lactis RW2-5 TaxID=1408189 RepID=A0A0K2GYS5_9CORY|nr:hypothetical protein [Corynebacterium lactis]ALA66631.1 membrane protein [Corynebacterium lactis RW2-5]